MGRRLVIVLLALLATPSAAGAAGLRIGVSDGSFSRGVAARDVSLQRAKAAGAQLVRVGTSWASIARRQPAAPEDPADRAYRWNDLDGALRAASGRGLEVLLVLTGAPPWAEGPGRPEGVSPGTWRPQAGAYGSFAKALATRYSGRYPDPARPGATLPRVSAYEPWNEPNLRRYLNPQWTQLSITRYVPESPRLYRDLLNAFAAAVKSVEPSALIVGGATAPFGDDRPGGTRIPPTDFVRYWLSEPTTFDVLSHHPYATREPLAGARSSKDVSVPDLGRLLKPLREAEAAGRLSPAGRRRLWVTEFSYDSSPPDPDGVPVERLARWVQQAMRSFAGQGVDTVTWFTVSDQVATPATFSQTFQSGLYYADGRVKPVRRAFSFPLTVGGRPLKVWTRSPVAGTLVIERLDRRSSGPTERWIELARTQVALGDFVTRRVPVHRGDRIRARVGDQASRRWTVR
jgi:polysaccharide biosynthesis protein PslG